MGNEIRKEPFVGKYNGVVPPILMTKGDISGGKNIRKVSEIGGWKGRKGCALHNTTAAGAGETINSLHYYKNPFNADEHFIAQANSLLYTETEVAKLPPALDATFGTSLGLAVGTTPGFSAQLGEYWFYADGSGRPVVWGGTSPRAKGFFVYDASETSYLDYTRKVTDGRADTGGVVLSAATDKFIVFSEERISAVVLVLGTLKNTTARTLAVKAWRSGAWAAVSSLSDGTEAVAADGKPFGKSGTISWTASASDLMRLQSGIMGYAYEFSWSDALSNAVDVVSVNVTQAASLLTNKWNGEHQWVTGCRFYDASLAEYQEALGKVTNESTSQYLDISAMQTGDFVYMKTPEPATAFGLGIPPGYGNTEAITVDNLEYWSGAAWTAIAAAAFTGDSTKGASKSLSQTGIISFDGSAASPQRRELSGDPIPGFWYRASVSGATSADTRIYAVTYIPFPEVLPAYDGCIDFKNRLFLWGDPEFPNRLRYSARENPTCLAGLDSGYTDAFGDAKKVLCAVKFYNELVVFKEDSVWLLEGDAPANFGTLKITDKVGLASPKSAQVSEVGFPSLHKDEPLTIVIWQDVDGIYTFDGRKTLKSSYPVENYFNTESSTCIAAASIRNRQAFVDPLNDEYHFLLPAGELVYNYAEAEWYPPWTRSVSLVTGLSFRANDGRFYTYGGAAGGFIMRLETDTSDKTIGNADVIISHSVKTRALAINPVEGMLNFTFRCLWAELKARTAGAIVTKTFKDLFATGVVQASPTTMSMISAVAGIVVPKVDISIEGCRYIQGEFSLATLDQEMQISGFGYEISTRGLGE